MIDCRFSQNTAPQEGGAIAIDQEQATVQNCLFIENRSGYGGAMHNSHYSARVTNCVFAYNTATNIGGAICAKDLRDLDRTQRITNCTFYGNIAEDKGGALGVFQSGSQSVTNSIFWNNIAYSEGPQIAGGFDSGDITVSYSCVQGGHWDVYSPSGAMNWLEGNIDLDPFFANLVTDDFHLKSTAGRWDTNSNTWVIDSNHSPCIDSGDPASDWTSEVWPHGQRINMGAFGGTSKASKSTTTGGNIADIDSSGSVDAVDLSLLAGKWLWPGGTLIENLNGDDNVNFEDFAILASNWGWKQ